MAFESLSDKLQNIFKNLRSKGRLTEDDVKAALKEVKIALLEADVSFKVVKDFIKKVQERAVGQDVMSSLTPGQMVIKIVNEELTALMGSETTELKLLPDNQITVIMMMGLQGAGKTTTTAKIAGKLKAKGKRPLLVACDVYRPAAIDQLKINGEKQQVPVFAMGDKQKPLNIAKASIEHAKKNGNNVVILDTAGRLHVDEDMMNELVEIRDNIDITQTVLVVDAMTGQDAVNVAKEFNEKIGIDGIIVTKLDGDTRGGAALSIKAVTGKPILYIGMGEKLSDLEQFHPDRMASRILGMGDVLSLIEKAEQAIDKDKAKEIIGIESIKDAVVNANRNAKKNGCAHVSFVCDDAANKLVYLSKKRTIDVLVVDPPRSGLDSETEKMVQAYPRILRSKIKEIVYVSCNAATLGKNLAVLQSCYHVEKVVPIDMFPHTPHVETVTLLRRKERRK